MENLEYVLEILKAVEKRDNNLINELISKDDKYDYALKDSVLYGYVKGLDVKKTATGFYVFQELEEFGLTETGAIFLNKNI